MASPAASLWRAERPGRPAGRPPRAAPWSGRLLVRAGWSMVASLPLVAVAVALYASGYSSPVHAALLADADAFRRGGDPAHLLGSGSLAGSLAAVVLHSQLGLAVVSCVVAGSWLTVAGRRVAASQGSTWFGVVLLLSVALLPPFVASVLESLPHALLLVGLAALLAGYRDFTRHDWTLGGISAGLWLGGGALLDIQIPVFGLFIVPTAPLVVLLRERGRRGVITATLLVILFPLAAVTALVELETWLTLGTALTPADLLGQVRLLESAGAARLSLRAPALLLRLLGCSSVWLAALALRSRESVAEIVAMLRTAVVLVALVAAGYPLDVNVALCIAAIMGLAAVPSRCGPRARALLVAASAVQVGVATFVWAATTPLLAEWLWTHLR